MSYQSSSSSSRADEVPAASLQRSDFAVSALIDSTLPLLPEKRRESRLKERQLRAKEREAKGESAPTSSTDGLAMLEDEHDHISTVMATIINRAEKWIEKPTTEREPDEAKRIDQLVDQLIQLVCHHASVEERQVYPHFSTKLRGTVDGVTADMIYERNLADDNMNKIIMDALRMMKMEKDGELLLATMKKLAMIEEEHMTQEERWFALLRHEMSAAELQAMSRSMTVSARFAPTYPHSVVGPSRTVPARLTHAVVGALDTVYDRLKGRKGLEDLPGGAKRVSECKEQPRRGEAKQME